VIIINKKIKLLIFLMCIIILMSTVTTTYSRYVSSSTGTVTTEFARWQLFINNQNISENYDSAITFIPTIEENVNVAANKIAPASKGFFDIAINPSNVDVSFTYSINFTIPEESIISDIKITDYAVVEGDSITDESVIQKVSFNGNEIQNTLFYDNSITNFSFKPFVIRVYFAWVDDDSGTMSDEDDSAVGNMLANGEDVNFELNANINFKQYISDANPSDEVESILENNDDILDENVDDNSTEIVDDNSTEIVDDSVTSQ